MGTRTGRAEQTSSGAGARGRRGGRGRSRDGREGRYGKDGGAGLSSVPVDSKRQLVSLDQLIQ